MHKLEIHQSTPTFIYLLKMFATQIPWFTSVKTTFKNHCKTQHTSSQHEFCAILCICATMLLLYQVKGKRSDPIASASIHSIKKLANWQAGSHCYVYDNCKNNFFWNPEIMQYCLTKCCGNL